MKSFIFSIEALFTLAAAAALAAYPLVESGSSYGEVHAAQLAQDLLEVGLKSPENARALAEFAEAGKSAFLEEKYSTILEQLGNYCLVLEAGEKAMRVNCGERTRRQAASAERIFLGGSGFAVVRLTLFLE